MTEDQAKTKWCPFAIVSRDHSQTSPGVNRQDRGTPEPHMPPACRCIASQCMAWQWDDISGENRSLWKGHCGLAGALT